MTWKLENEKTKLGGIVCLWTIMKRRTWRIN